MKEGDKVLDTFGRRAVIRNTLSNGWTIIQIGGAHHVEHESNLRPDTWFQRLRFRLGI